MPEQSVVAYPWHADLWNTLSMRLEQNTLPHALLLVTSAELGQLDLSRQWAQRVLCADPEACAQAVCRSCHLFKVRSNPDFFLLELEDNAKFIKIEQVRQLTDRLCQKPHLSSKRVVVISDADKMTTSAANALLKTLEEPISDTHFILLAAHKNKLLPTIASRCQHLLLQASMSGAVDWLAEHSITPLRAKMLLNIADGSPLAALEIANSDFLAVRAAVLEDLISLFARKSSVMQLTRKWLELDVAQLRSILYNILNDLLKLSAGVGEHLLNYPDLADRTVVCLGLLLPMAVHEMLAALSFLREEVGANKSLQIENFLINWLRFGVK